MLSRAGEKNGDCSAHLTREKTPKFQSWLSSTFASLPCFVGRNSHALICDIRVIRGSYDFRISRVTQRGILRSTPLNSETSRPNDPYEKQIHFVLCVF
jgi:hypothetical protein